MARTGKNNNTASSNEMLQRRVNMSVEETKPEVESQKQDEPVETTVDLKTLMETVQQLKANNERLEYESRKWKSRAKEIESANDDVRRQNLEAEGNWKEIVELEKRKREEAEARLANTNRQYLDEKFRAEVAMHARDAIKPEYIANLLPSVAKDFLKIDRENLKIEGVADAIKFLRESDPYLFQVDNVPGTVNSRPQGKPQEKKLNEMTYKEKTSLLENLI